MLKIKTVLTEKNKCVENKKLWDEVECCGMKERVCRPKKSRSPLIKKLR